MTLEREDRRKILVDKLRSDLLIKEAILGSYIKSGKMEHNNADDLEVEIKEIKRQIKSLTKNNYVEPLL